jgi:hypothetical protein
MSENQVLQVLVEPVVLALVALVVKLLKLKI